MSLPLGTIAVNLVANTAAYTRGMSQASLTTTKASQQMATSIEKFGKRSALAVVAFAAASVVAYAKFDKAMTNSTAIMTGMNAQLRADMEATARSVSRNTTTSATEAAQAYFYLASAGMDAQQSMAALATVENFGAAGAFDMAKATDLLTDAQSALGLSSKEAAENQMNLARVSDVLIKANTLANATAEQFAKSLTSKAGAALRLLNKDVEEGVAVLAAFADQGVKAELAGERLNIVLRDLQSASLKNAEAWEALNVNVYDAQGRMLPMVDMIRQLEGLLGNATDKQKKMTLATLGFQDRSQSAIVSLLGMSDKIQEYETNLRNAAGTTEDVADKQLQSFSAQMDILKNRIVDVAISVGEKLVPVLRIINDYFDTLYTSTGNFTYEVALLADIFQTGLLVGIGAVADAFQGWQYIMKAGQIVMIQVAQMVDFVGQAGKVAFLGIGTAVLTMIDNAMKPFVWQLNQVIKLSNTLLGTDYEEIDLIDTAALEGKFTDAKNQFFAFKDQIDEGTDEYSTAVQKVAAEMIDMYESGRPSDALFAAVDKMRDDARAAKAEGDKATRAQLAASKATTDAAEATTDAVTEQTYAMKELKAESDLLKESLTTPFEKSLTEIQRFDEMLKAGLITVSQFQLAASQLEGMSGGIPGYGTAGSASTGTVDAELNGVAAGYGAASMQEDPTRGTGVVSDASRLNEQQDALKAHYEEQRSIIEESEFENAQLKEDIMTQMAVQYNSQMDAYAKVRNQMMLDSATQQLDLLMSVMRDAGEEGSTAYKAMFAMQQAFLIVQTIMNTEAAAAQALALYTYAGPAMAGVIRGLGYASVGIIAGQTIASFEGGGMTPSGSRSGGMDGKGGMMAMLHPNEKVTDLTKEDTSGGNGDITVNVINKTGTPFGEPVVSKRSEGGNMELDIIIDAVKADIISDIDKGGNSLSQVLQSRVGDRRSEG